MRTDQKLFMLKCILSIFLIILWILGSAVFGILLWLRMHRWAKEYLDLEVTSFGHFSLLVYIAQADVSLIILFSLCGLIGGLRTIKCALVMYLVALLLAFGMTVAGSVYGFLYRQELRDTMDTNEVMVDIIRLNYSNESMHDETVHVDKMQSEFLCCGGNGAADYVTSNWYYADEANRKDMAPASCCKDYIMVDNSELLCPIWAKNDPGSQDKQMTDKIHAQGCNKALVDFFDTYILFVAGVAIALGVMQLICLVVVSVLIHVLNNLYVLQPDDIVYDMARNQEKSPYPSRGDYKEYYT